MFCIHNRRLNRNDLHSNPVIARDWETVKFGAKVKLLHLKASLK